ncbi:Gfo/Idh/MocA family protein [Deinococcus pimensis]|uniref:Gfo/Idh/MocA family protein n=1 Tax=Deinococcus pimensis TaxID=309888 RepID=UPI000485ED92|nr:Gfo/Idh/MocA family oxidoreductase [Deinococcus pimensis]
MALRIGLIGAGSRGLDVYGRTMLAQGDRCRVVAVAEPHHDRLRLAAAELRVPGGGRFADPDAFWTAARGLDLDAVVIASPDRSHHAHVLEAVRLEVPMLLEKPAAHSLPALRDLRRRLSGYRPPVMIAHVLRYTAFFRTVHDLLSSGAVGRLVHLNHTENIGYWHFAHSFVRGNWRDEATSSPMVLAKASHDLDLLRWLVGAPPRRVTAFGRLHHFRPDQAPVGAPEHCLDGCPAEPDCPYSARKIYLERFQAEGGWPNNVVTPDPSRATLLEALARGPYGRCVYRCDNSVHDTYSINILFENDVTAAFTLSAFTEETTRTVHVMGTHGELHGHLDRGEVVVNDFRSRERRVIRVPATSGGHGGGDEALTLSFLDLVERYRGGEAVTSATAFEECLDAHLMAFEAHEDALRHRVGGPA